MVLFSRKTHTALAALTLKADDPGCVALLTERPSPSRSSEPYFQGMLALPDQKFSFTITNLSNRGRINFNILHAPNRTGPSFGINEVNELRSNESHTVVSDQRTKRRMILKVKNRTVKDPMTQREKRFPLTVGDSEKSNEGNLTGLYFYLSVSPDATCQSLVEWFSEGTMWKAVPGFVQRLPGAARISRSRDQHEVPQTFQQLPPAQQLNIGAPLPQPKTEDSSRIESSVPSSSAPPLPSGQIPEFNLLLIGDGCVGKTTFVKRQGGCEKTYVATLGTKITTLKFYTNRGPIKFNVCDTAGQEKLGKLRDGYYIGGECAIIMFDVTSFDTYDNIQGWHRDLTRVCKDIPVVLCGNKAESKDLKVASRNIAFEQRREGLPYWDVSAETNLNLEEPFLWLARRLSGDDRLHFVEAPALQPPDLSIDEETKARYETELAQAASLPLLEEDDEDYDDSSYDPTPPVSYENEFSSTGLSSSSIFQGDITAPNAEPREGEWQSVDEHARQFAAHVDVSSTQAGELQYGEKVEVESMQSRRSYAYEQASDPAVLCLSIWEGMILQPPPNPIAEQLAAEVQEWIKSEGQGMIGSLCTVFKADKCVIDLESEADTIICSCGHQCVNHANVGSLKFCPVCRNPITAFVKASGVVEV
eukprot:CAMPEP_0113556620 /NCGR_PEP_ID=MMETSP0015_2-20120614/17349_1 /TAXON_ID=2838 /ORGANISM="Odontella" /LENGTH=645 /DNA_ID=CAMNT_0000457979 /DNA_START=240 /DNA_END=2177 /DNA_ORIENTATION=+ /assembly_acc=CAM_ASM_000160